MFTKTGIHSTRKISNKTFLQGYDLMIGGGGSGAVVPSALTTHVDAIAEALGVEPSPHCCAARCTRESCPAGCEELTWYVSGKTGMVRKQAFSEPFYIKTIILPRQARTNEEKWRKQAAFSAGKSDTRGQPCRER
jgi:hypothetical protein